MVEPMVGVRDLEKLYGNPRSWWYQAAESGRIPSYRIGTPTMVMRTMTVSPSAQHSRKIPRT